MYNVCDTATDFVLKSTCAKFGVTPMETGIRNSGECVYMECVCTNVLSVLLSHKVILNHELVTVKHHTYNSEGLIIGSRITHLVVFAKC